MEISVFFQELTDNLKSTTYLEYIAVITGLLSVWYARKENILVYPVGIISVLLYVWLCYYAGLYADMSINAYYFFMSVFGWYKWTRKDNVKNIIRQIGRCNRIETAAALAGIVVFTVFLQWILKEYTNSTVPWLDSFTTSVFIIGMWLMALKKVENWIYWIIGDAICVFLFPYKGLVFSGFQYLVFLVIAIMGYIDWRKKWKVIVLEKLSASQ